MAHTRIRALAERLEAQGIDASALVELELELEAIERPPGLVAGLTHAVRQRARKQWHHVRGEMDESKEAWSLLRRRIAGRTLSPAETELVRRQVADLMRVLPASMIAATNYTLPVPGTSFLTPMLLNRLGLLPSRWREAHLLGQLRKEAQRLRTEGKGEAAAAIDSLEQRLELEAQQREAALADATLLTRWDANGNGVWDPEEREAYQAEVLRLQAVASQTRHQRAWFMQWEGMVFGPVVLGEYEVARTERGLLVSYKGESGWVALADLLQF